MSYFFLHRTYRSNYEYVQYQQTEVSHTYDYINVKLDNRLFVWLNVKVTWTEKQAMWRRTKSGSEWHALNIFLTFHFGLWFLVDVLIVCWIYLNSSILLLWKMLKKVLLSTDVTLACVQHALSTEKEEIMGLLIGEVSTRKLYLYSIFHVILNCSSINCSIYTFIQMILIFVLLYMFDIV